MCGIAGEYHFNKKNISLLGLEKALLKLFNRGPEDGKIYCEGGVALGHRRLKIFDLTSRAMQPMVDPELGLALVFNGAIYNFLELRKELQAKGYSFVSDGDTEVLLKAYHAWGTQCILKLHGMFAFAILEQKTGKLILARDRFGIKPLYYNTNYSTGFKFASTLPALIEYKDIDTSIDKIALQFYLTFHAVPDPYTILSGVKKLPPGSMMTVYPNGEVKQETYWKLKVNDTQTDHLRSENDWLKSTHEALRLATKHQLVADVPVGILLSGGLDSSLLVALASELGKEDIQTFSIGFEDSHGEDGDEFIYSDLIASQYRTRHQKIFFSNTQLTESLGKCVTAMSEPMLSYDNIGFYMLSQEVAKSVKVVLSGQGADELFAGYHWFQNIVSGTFSSKQSAQFILNKVADRHFEEYQRLVTPAFYTSPHTSSFLTELCEQNGSPNIVDNLLCYESTFALTNGPLSRVDNMTMAASLEARVPFLDDGVVNLATAMPLHYKLPNEGKYILKQLAKKMLPEQIISRPKGYFPVPGLKYIEGSTLELMREVLSSTNIEQRGIFNKEIVQMLLAQPKKHFTPWGSSKLWQIGLLEYWLQLHGL